METRECSCEKHGKYNSEPVQILGRIISWTQCPKCVEDQEQKEAAEEERKRQEFQQRRLQASGVEPEFYDATLQDFKPESQSEVEALQAATALLNGSIKKLILLGTNGCGKTHLACALVKLTKGIRITMFELSCRIRSCYNSGVNEIDYLDNLLTYPLIVIDEVGRTKGSDAEKNWMSYLVDKAHTRGTKLMLISNRQRAASLPQERKGEAFEYYFDNDVLSRLRQDAKIVEVKGRDRRATASQI